MRKENLPFFRPSISVYEMRRSPPTSLVENWRHTLRNKGTIVVVFTPGHVQTRIRNSALVALQNWNDSIPWRIRGRRNRLICKKISVGLINLSDQLYPITIGLGSIIRAACMNFNRSDSRIRISQRVYQSLINLDMF